MLCFALLLLLLRCAAAATTHSSSLLLDQIEGAKNCSAPSQSVEHIPTAFQQRVLGRGISEWDRQTGECYYLFIHCINRWSSPGHQERGTMGHDVVEIMVVGWGERRRHNDLPEGIPEMGFAGVLCLLGWQFYYL